MRIGYIIIVIIGQVVSLSGQDLLVDGAEWYYSLNTFGLSGIDFNRCYIEGDTVIQEKTCLTYVQENLNCNGRPKRNYLYKENDKIYFFDQDDESFKILYDFSLVVGDTMIYETGIHYWDLQRRTHYILIESVERMFFNSIELKSFGVKYGFLDDGQVIFSDYSSQIIEDIGSTNNFFHFSDDTGFCDDKSSLPLRCFSAPDFPTVLFDDIGCRTVATQGRDINKTVINSYPNPFTEEFTIEAQGSVRPGEVYLLDSYGRIQHQQKWPSNTTSINLNLSQLPAGIYWIQLKSKTNDIGISGGRIIKLNK